MKAIHLVNRKIDGKPENLDLLNKNDFTYISGNWELSDEERHELENGLIYLHETKSSISHNGGKIISISDSDGRPGRYKIKFRADKTGKSTKWRGADHTMAYKSIVEV